MITIRYRDDGKSRTLEVQGHGPGPQGRDVYCAGASVLMMTLQKNLEGIEHKAHVSDGYAAFKSSAPESKAVFSIIMRGFLELQEQAPEQYNVQTF